MAASKRSLWAFESVWQRIAASYLRADRSAKTPADTLSVFVTPNPKAARNAPRKRSNGRLAAMFNSLIRVWFPFLKGADLSIRYSRVKACAREIRSCRVVHEEISRKGAKAGTGEEEDTDRREGCG